MRSSASTCTRALQRSKRKMLTWASVSLTSFGCSAPPGAYEAFQASEAPKHEPSGCGFGATTILPEAFRPIPIYQPLQLARYICDQAIHAFFGRMPSGFSIGAPKASSTFCCAGSFALRLILRPEARSCALIPTASRYWSNARATRGRGEFNVVSM